MSAIQVLNMVPFSFVLISNTHVDLVFVVTRFQIVQKCGLVEQHEFA